MQHMITIGYNTGTDASPVWSGTALAFGGSAGANELRYADTGAGATGTTPSASWPYTTRPTSGSAPVRQLWAFTTDAVGSQVATYDGTNAHANVLRLSHSADGNFVSAPRFSAFANNTNPTPAPGTQVSNPTDGANIINGTAGDTAPDSVAGHSTSYLKGNAYGSGLNASVAQETPTAAAVGTLPTATTGTYNAGALNPAAGAWLATWASMQGWNSYVQAVLIPHNSTAYYWYLTFILFMGVNLLPGVMPLCPLVYDYTYA